MATMNEKQAFLFKEVMEMLEESFTKGEILSILFCFVCSNLMMNYYVHDELSDKEIEKAMIANMKRAVKDFLPEIKEKRYEVMS